MSEQHVHEPGGHGQVPDRDRDDVLDAAKPLPSGEDDLSDDEDRLFLAAILDA
jgi:hypothetical protein